MVVSPIHSRGLDLPLPSTGGEFGLGLPRSPLFGTDGIRGKAGELLTAPLALSLGFWAGQVLKQQANGAGPVIIGQDSRLSSDMLANAMAAGLNSAGVEVWQLGLCPTPCVAYLTRKTAAIGGIMISASHNPPEDNGIKFFDEQGLKLPKSLAMAIEAGLRGQHQTWTINTSKWGRSYGQPQQVQHYQDFLLSSLPQPIDFHGLKVVLDLAWGASVNLAPHIFRSLGAEVIALHHLADGSQINVDCGSTHLHGLQKAVQEAGADLGFAFDGDADRVMAVDAQGQPVDGDYILFLWGKTLQKSNHLPDNLIVGTVMANLAFERAWEKLGGKLIRTAVGDQNVQAQMWETGAMLGGEQSGHIICHHHSYSGDGLQAALHLTALVKQSGLSLGELLEESFQPYPQILRNVRVLDRELRLHWQECESLQQAIATAEAAMGSAGRILVRASGTEPLIRVMVEASCATTAVHWSDKLTAAVRCHLEEN
ncbi:MULTISPECIES: phosphoglucosamine mutase [unclassified Synechocystis]|uniref:phosphoglucosamine mutase n=1 Tax=unclassified Synechocystis TaxID=2640012 RepID=UPI0004019AB8|nr:MULTISPECIES: phosphoglucosamine mutase [unclassified Synechocystis]AIE75377.1 Phosphoglucosamine mutase [Synechocystis sp. PCC 6714]MCT0253610.1 phosphoglucosamine mutase [Synechocystis sp. CS-94]